MTDSPNTSFPTPQLTPALLAPPPFRLVRLLIGGVLSLVILLVALWSASKALESVLMTLVWGVQATGGGTGVTLADPFSPMLQDATEKMMESPSAFALDALQALGWTLLGLGVVWGLVRLRRKTLGLLLETSLTRFIGGRYLLARHRRALVSLITVISVLGIAVGVTALIVVISVIDGFDRVLVQRTMGIFSHVEVWPYYYEKGLSNYEEVMEKASKAEGVVAIAPIINQQTFFQKELGIERYRVGGLLRGLDPGLEAQVTTLMDNILEGKASPGDREVVVGRELARRLDVGPGDTIWAMGKVVSTPHRGAAPKLLPLRVVGIFKSGLYDIDASFAYANLKTIQDLFVMRNPQTRKDSVSVVHLKLKDPDKAIESAIQLQRMLGSNYIVRPWQQINPQFFEALRMEKMAMFVILLLIVLVASFNIVGTLIMVVTQKTREIGILKSMGATKAAILRIFLFHGLIIGVVGTGLGLALGMRIIWFVENHIEKIYQLPGNVYYGLDRLPVVVEPLTLTVILSCSLVISLFASIIPAIQASRLNPVEALRYE